VGCGDKGKGVRQLRSFLGWKGCRGAGEG
jgi:hypothetical protein